MEKKLFAVGLIGAAMCAVAALLDMASSWEIHGVALVSLVSVASGLAAALFSALARTLFKRPPAP